MESHHYWSENGNKHYSTSSSSESNKNASPDKHSLKDLRALLYFRLPNIHQSYANPNMKGTHKITALFGCLFLDIPLFHQYLGEMMVQKWFFSIFFFLPFSSSSTFSEKYCSCRTESSNGGRDHAAPPQADAKIRQIDTLSDMIFHKDYRSKLGFGQKWLESHETGTNPQRLCRHSTPSSSYLANFMPKCSLQEVDR